MKKRLRLITAAFVLLLGIIMAGVRYFTFVSETIYTESVAHLTEIFRQTNFSLTTLVNQNWTNLHMWEGLGDCVRFVKAGFVISFLIFLASI